jgi:hypothetical protein
MSAKRRIRSDRRVRNGNGEKCCMVRRVSGREWIEE